MERKVKLFVISKEKTPGGPPQPAREITIKANDIDGLRDAVRKRITEDGLRIRTISFGKTYLVAYAEEIS